MSRVVDSKVVEMRFDNGQFEKGVAESMATLDKLKSKLEQTNDGSSFEQLQAAANRTNFDNLSESVQALEKRFSTMGIVGITVLQRLTNAAITAGRSMLTAIPSTIIHGGWSRAMKIEESIHSLKGLGYAWGEVGTQVSRAVDGTAYGLDEAAKAASNLTTAGVKVGNVIEKNGEKLDSLEMSLKAISGVAAQTNSGFTEIANVLTKMASAGKITGETLMQLTYRGLNVAAILAKELGTSVDDVRDKISKGLISSEQVFEILYDRFWEHAKEANNTFSGSFANMLAALKKIGANFAQPIIQQSIEVFNALRQSFNEAKTVTERFAKYDASAREAAKTRVAQLKKELEELPAKYRAAGKSTAQISSKMKELSSELNNAKKSLNDTYSTFERFAITLKNSILEPIKTFDWNFLEGLLNGFYNIANNTYIVLKNIGQAIKYVFPTSFSESLKSATDSFANFTENLKPTREALLDIKLFIAGIFSVVKLVGDVLGEIVTTIFPKLSDGTGNIFHMIGTGFKYVGAFLIVITRMVRESGLIQKAISGIATALKTVAGIIVYVGSEVYNFASQLNLLSIAEIIMGGIATAGATIAGVFNSLVRGAKELYSSVRALLDDGFTPLQILLGIIYEAGIRVSSALSFLTEKIGGFGSVTSMLDNLTNRFKKLKDAIFAKPENDAGLITIIDEDVPLAGHKLGRFGEILEDFGSKIANFVANIDWGRVALVAFIGVVSYMGIQLGRLFGAMADTLKKTSGTISTFQKVLKGGLKGLIKGTESTKKMPSKIVQFAASILILAAAMKVLETVDEDKFVKCGIALAAMGAGLGVLVGVLALCQMKLGKDKNIAQLSAGFVSIAMSILILAAAMKVLETVDIKKIDNDTLGALILSVAGVTAMVIALNMFAPKLKAGAVTILACAMSINLLVKSLEKLSKAKTDNLNQDKVAYLVEMMGALALMSVICSKVGFKGFAGLLPAAIAVTLAVNALNKLTDEDIKKIVNNITSVQFAILGLETIFFMALLLAKKVNNDPFKNLGIGIAGIGVAMLAMVGVIKICSTIKNTDGLWAGVGAIAVMMTLITLLAMASGMTKDSQMVKFAASMLILTGVITAMSVLAVILGGVKDVDAMQRGIAMVMGLMGLVGVLMLCSAATSKVDMKSLVGFLLMLNLLIAEIAIISHFADFNELADAVFGMALMMGGLVTAFGILGKTGQSFQKNKLIAIGEMIGMLVVIAGSLAALSLVGDTSKMAVGAGSIAGVLVMVAGAIQIVGESKVNIKQVEMFAVAIGSIVAIGLSLTFLAQQDIAGLITAAGSMVGVILVMSEAIKIVSDAKINQKQLTSMVIAAGTFVALGIALALIATQDWQSILAAMGAMVASIAVMAGALVLMGTFGAGGGIAMIEMAAGLMVLAVALNAMTTISWETLGQAGAALGGLTAALILLALAFTFLAPGAALIDTVLASLTVVLLGFSVAAVAVGVAGNLLALALNMMVLPLQALSQLDLPTLALGLLEVAGALLAFAVVGTICMFVAVAFSTFSFAIMQVGFSVGVAAVSIAAGAYAIGAAIDFIRSKFSNDLAKAGTDGVQGLVDGIEGNLGAVQTSAREISDTFFDQFRADTGWHSPWASMEGAGQDAIIGLGQGLSSPTLLEKIKSIISGITGWIKDMFGNLGDWISNWFEHILDDDGGGSDIIETISSKMDDVMGSMTTDLGGWDFEKEFQKITAGAAVSSPAMNDLASSMDAASGSGHKLGNTNKDLANSMKDLKYESKELEEEVETTYEHMRKIVENAVKPFDKFNRSMQITSERLIENMKSQLEGIGEWGNMLKELGARGLSSSLMQYLAEMGPEGYKYVQAFYDMTEEELAEANSLYSDLLSIDEETATTITQGFDEAGMWAVAGFTNGIKENQVEAIRQAGMMGTYTLNELKSVLEINSPSKKTRMFGMFFVQGMVNGISENIPLAVDKSNEMGTKTTNKVKEYVNYDTGLDYGHNFGAGLVQGLWDMVAEAEEAAMALAVAVQRGIELAGKIHSPSRVTMEDGHWFGQGLRLGLLGEKDAVEDAASELANSLTRMLNVAMNESLNVLEDDDNLSPVITPVLDLTQVQNGSASLAKMLSANMTTSAAAGSIASGMSAKRLADANKLEAQAASTSEPSVVNTFNQYNTSPKALSATEIYRQTKNIFTAQKGALATK